jgi:probable HAF family extracellular repeat protein
MRRIQRNWVNNKAWEFVLVAFLVQVGGAFAQTYTITDLGAVGGTSSESRGMNGSGDVVGDYDPGLGAYMRAFYYHNGLNVSLPTVSGPYAIANAINHANQIVGESSVGGSGGPGFDIHAFFYTNGSAADLGTLGGNYAGGYSSARAINQGGDIVGESTVSAANKSSIHAMLYRGGAKTDLGALGGDYSSANGINASGLIVGETDVVLQGTTNIHAFVYTNGTMIDLDTLPGGTYSSARAINDSGVIVGESEVLVSGSPNLHAFVYRNGIMTDIGTFGGDSSSANAVNSAGDVVGYAYEPNGVSDAFLYRGSGLIRLSSLISPNSGWTNLTIAAGINDLGQIAGSGLLANGDYHAFLLAPVVPQTLSLRPLAVLANGQFELQVQGTPGQSFVLQASTNLIDWLGLSTNTLSGTVTNLTDTSAPGYSFRYYRAQLQP